jgi:transmembrane sensor
MSQPRIKYLLKQHSGDGLTSAEMAELAIILKETELGDEVRAVLQEILNETPNDERIQTQNWQPLLAKIVSVDQFPAKQVSAHRIHFLRRRFFRYAAAVVIVFGIGAYFWTTNKFANDNRQVQTDVLPGGDKAVLTLADGSKIVLDSAANGNLAQQGNAAIVKLANGQIAYKLKGLAGSDVMMNTMATPKGGQYQLTLPDGSKVWLNAASSITYPVAFVQNTRSVKVTGEVYFEVAKNKEKPFIVDIDGKSSVQVLGTSFNVNSYEDEGSINTTLIEGSVKVMLGSTNAVLKPGQQAQISTTAVAAVMNDSLDPGKGVHAFPPRKSDGQPRNTAGIVVISNPDIDQVLAWKNGLFNFNGSDLRGVMRQLQRWYDIEVQYNGSVDNGAFRGRIYRNVHLSDVLDILQEAGGVKFKLEGKTLVVL